MKPKDVQKVLSTLQDTLGAALDHMAGRFGEGSDKLEAEFEHLAQFAGSWKKQPKKARRLFVEQLLKSYALVVAGTVAAKAGVTVAKKSQKDIRRIILNVADLLQPVATDTVKRGKSKAKKAKKRLKKAVS